MLGGLLHWFLHDFTGSDNESGTVYGLWSGFGGDVSVLAGMSFAAYHVMRARNCHVRGCWRMHNGREVPGTSHKVCRRHHPQPDGPTHEDVLADHREANA